MEDTDNKELFEFLDTKFGGIDRDFYGEPVNPVRARLFRNIVPLSLFALAILFPKAGGHIFVGMYLALQTCLFFVDYAQPDPDPKTWTPEESALLIRYSVALRYPLEARAASRQLNVFRWIGLLMMAPVLLWNHMWIAAGIIIVSFLNPVMSALAVRLNPAFYLGNALRRGENQFKSELTMLMRVSNKLDGSLPAAKPAPTLEDAFAAHGRGEYDSALTILGPFAEKGSAEALSFLAGMYYEGQGVPRDYKEAARLYRKAAEQGHAVAQKRLGDLCYKGLGVPRDRGEAAKWYRRAADQGDADAQFCLGGIFFDEQAKALLKGTPPNIYEPIKWYSMAAEQGHAEAQYSLGVLYSGDMFGKPDFVQAYKWLDIAVSRIPESNSKAREKSVRGRDSIAGLMTQEQVAEAQRLAREWRPSPAAESGQSSRSTTVRKDDGTAIKGMNRMVKTGIVLGYYTVAMAVAYILVDIRQAQNTGPDSQASSGMYAFGDLVLFIGSFCIMAIVPTVLAFYFIRPDAKLWKVLSRISNFRF